LILFLLKNNYKLINQIIFLTAFKGYVKSKNALASGALPRTPLGGACSAPPEPLAEISNILFEIITKLFFEVDHSTTG